jgi:O-antigen ligase
MDFILFILVNATLFLRPAEVIPGMQDVELYKFLIIPCLVSALPAVLEQFKGERLAARPITVCVLGLWVAVVVSLLAHGEVDKAAEEGLGFAKAVAYFLLLVAVINSPERLKRFLFWLMLFATGATLLAVLRYNGLIELPNITTLQDRRADEMGNEQVFLRLVGTGLFRDPNDFTLLLVLGIPLVMYRLIDSGGGLGRVLWLAPLALFGYALAMTQSRGGFLAVVFGLCVLFWARFGKQKSLLLMAAVLPALFLLLEGRQTEVLNDSDTAQQRYQLWSDGLMLLRESPVYGIGANEFSNRAGLEAHNSFVHAYAELGLVGGTLFLGAFFLGLWQLYRLGSARTEMADPTLGRLQPYVLALVAGYVGAMLSLSHVYTVPTYTALGLASAYLGLAMAWPTVPAFRFNTQLVQRFALVGFSFLLVTYVVVRVVVRWR